MDSFQIVNVTVLLDNIIYLFFLLFSVCQSVHVGIIVAYVHTTVNQHKAVTISINKQLNLQKLRIIPTVQLNYSHYAVLPKLSV